MIVTDASAAILALVTVNVPVVAPAATVTVPGTVAADVLLEDAVSVKPPVGAGLDSVTVPVEFAIPPTTVVGFRASVVTVGAVTPTVAVLLVVPVVPVIVAVTFEATATVVAVNVAVLEPAATVTDAGTVVDASLDARVTASPPVGAFALRVTVPVEELPPTNEVGLIVTVLIVGTTTVSRAVLVAPPKDAVIVTIC